MRVVLTGRACVCGAWCVVYYDGVWMYGLILYYIRVSGVYYYY